MKFEKDTIQEFRKNLEGVLQDLEMRYGVTFSIGTIKYSKDVARMELKCIAGIGEDAERLEFERYCGRYGLKPEDYRRSVYSDGLSYQLTGFDLKAKKYKYIIYDPLMGKNYKTSRISFAQ